jgi:excisionase family DNA binding protein
VTRPKHISNKHPSVPPPRSVGGIEATVSSLPPETRSKPDQDGPTPLLTVAETASALNMSEAWVRKGILERRIPYTKLGRSIRFTHEQVAQIIAAGEQPHVNDRIDRAPGRRTARTKL